MSEADRQRQRPGPSAKADQILRAATQVFMDQGYGAASMDTVARRAGVSKATVYAHFSSKEQLFAAIVRGECRHHARAMSAPDIAAAGVEEALYRIGENFLRFILTPRSLAIFRVVIAETPRFPELGRIFYESGPAIIAGELSAHLAGMARAGRLDVDDPARAAEQFFGMLRGNLRLRCLLGEPADVSDAGIERAVRAAVAAFLRAYAPTGA